MGNSVLFIFQAKQISQLEQIKKILNKIRKFIFTNLVKNVKTSKSYELPIRVNDNAIIPTIIDLLV
jgi:hypothetical protein